MTFNSLLPKGPHGLIPFLLNFFLGVDIRKDFLEDELNAYLLDLFRGMVPEG